jgi:2-polyprenyl-3-methyl-5-hydroxy-6-metoxy-1,4-benzoquinol methylase
MTCSTQSAQQALTERLFQSTIQTLELYGVYLGKRLGLYRALQVHGALTAPELAAAAGIAPRYAREWLEQQAVAGMLTVDDTLDEADARRFRLPSSHAAVLADDEDAAHVAPFAEMVVGIGGALPQVVEAYRTGAGVPYSAYGDSFRDGQSGINKPAFLHDLTAQWLPAVTDLHGRLKRPTPRARIADVGCGAGWSTIALARAYPDADVVGYDLDAASVADARRNALARGVDARFVHSDAAALAGDGPFDLVLVLEALHDMAQPAKALAALRRALAADGSVIVADERVAERFTAPGDATERMMYGWSVSHCLPVAMSDQPSAAIGTAIRPETVRACAAEAGFARVEIVPIEHELFRFYRLRGAR